MCRRKPRTNPGMDATLRGRVPGGWFDGKWRGRTRARNVILTNTPGIMPQNYAGGIPNDDAPRNRGLDRAMVREALGHALLATTGPTKRFQRFSISSAQCCTQRRMALGAK